MSAYLKNPAVWQESWDRQQQAFMPDREERFGAMLDAVAAVTDGDAPRLLDLAGGTGSISLRLLARFPKAQVTVLDQDPVLMAVAESSLRDRGSVIDADLKDGGWRSKLPGEPFDAVLTATALHWLPAERVSELYAEVREVLRPGGVFANADHMEDEGLPELSPKLIARRAALRDVRYATGAATSWPDWWARAAADEQLAAKAAERALIYPENRHHQEWNPPATWHVEALRKAGYREAGVLWRGGPDAAVAGIR
ncbi:class I SAM-dependent methyltransferase [Actinoplanes couchii]|uniref:Methyltransferase n=1 Tax=Actinoplanes couchii TaxID=403638 RepID=A0ABQ3X4V4_9ACTN|nr:class I SAM-dependent methyltransferase [Actinoplanes couchii]MDR6326122.1 SAM-dependent methyltransferase [Actinoplanes couchii]GID53524.1 methyltransferase [Actinoplanes couchii]